MESTCDCGDTEASTESRTVRRGEEERGAIYGSRDLLIWDLVQTVTTSDVRSSLTQS